MITHKLPNIGDKLFLMHREVTVTKIYSSFSLAFVRYLGEKKDFIVDICSLSDSPNYTSSVSLGILRRNKSE